MSNDRKKIDQSKISGGVNFDLEEDAEEIFRDFLEHDNPPTKKSDEPKQVSKTASDKQESHEIDLHGMTSEQAEAFVGQELSRLLDASRNSVEVTVITGKGRRSGAQGGVLVKTIYGFVKNSFRHQIVKIDADPAADLVEGLPRRGFFKVTLKK